MQELRLHRPVLVPLFAIALAPLVRSDVMCQIDSTTSSQTVSATPGERYAMGGFGRFFWGDHYRDAWITQIEHVEVLDLDTFGGGITPTQRGGGRQTKSLRFSSADGREFSFRSIDKDPAAALPPLLRTTVAADVVQDQISSQHPLGPLVSDPILQAAGVLHAQPTLVVMPDDPRLGEYREEFAGMLGLIEERPNEFQEDLATFGAEQIIGSERLMERIERSPADRVNSRAFLNARLIDFYLGDWDRHIDQWRWAYFGSDSMPGWYPVPRDRDQVFSKLDGIFPSLAQWSMPQIVGYSDEYLSILSLHWNSRDIDRRFLSDLEWPVWDSIATSITVKITDDVIDRAVHRLPSEIYAIDGVWFEETLESRRDRLGAAAKHFYELLARDVEVYATDEAEQVQITEDVGGLINVALAERTSAAEPYFERQFDPSETDEVRIHLLGGDDRVAVQGSERLHVRIRVVGGEGDDIFDFATATRGIKLYDAHGNNRITGDPGARASINDKPYEVGEQTAIRDWGASVVPTGTVGFSSDYGVLFGAGLSHYRYGFRKDPFSSKWTLRAAVATQKRYDIFVEYEHRFENSPRHIHARAYGTSFDVVHYYGLGNGNLAPGSADLYKAERRLFTFEPLLSLTSGRSLDLSVGPAVRYSDTEANEGRFIATIPDLYGAEGFGQAGMVVAGNLDTRGDMTLEEVEHLADLTGVRLDVSGRFYPALWDVESSYGAVSAVGRAYVPAWVVPGSMLALQAGGQKVWGDAPWFDAAFIGGEETVRGLRAQRYAGDASLYGSAELRIYLTDINILVPQLFGVFGLFDVGRVWVDGDSPGGWHTGYGGGIWIGFLGARYLLSAAYARSEEGGGLYIGSGFGF